MSALVFSFNFTMKLTAKIDPEMLPSVTGRFNISDKFSIINIFEVCIDRLMLILIVLNR